MGSSSHLKRLAMPRSWPLPRKTTVWVTRPSPGGHSLERCMPVNLIIRDVLGRAQSSREGGEYDQLVPGSTPIALEVPQRSPETQVGQRTPDELWEIPVAQAR